MKRLLALVLTLALLLAVPCSYASADTLTFTPGEPSACTFEIFQMLFDLLMEDAGYTFVWSDEVAKDETGVYDVYTADTEIGQLVCRIFVKDGYVAYAESDGSISVDLSDGDAGNLFGQYIGAFLSDAVFSLFIGENGMDALTEERINQLMEELNGLVGALDNGLSNEADLADGIIYTTTFLGYPTGMEVSGTISGFSISLEMRLLISSVGGELSE